MGIELQGRIESMDHIKMKKKKKDKDNKMAWSPAAIESSPGGLLKGPKSSPLKPGVASSSADGAAAGAAEPTPKKKKKQKEEEAEPDIEPTPKRSKKEKKDKDRTPRTPNSQLR